VLVKLCSRLKARSRVRLAASSALAACAWRERRPRRMREERRSVGVGDRVGRGVSWGGESVEGGRFGSGASYIDLRC
jgi:hypothetical protein